MPPKKLPSAQMMPTILFNEISASVRSHSPSCILLTRLHLDKAYNAFSIYTNSYLKSYKPTSVIFSRLPEQKVPDNTLRNSA